MCKFEVYANSLPSQALTIAQWPTISESRLPQRVLEKIQHLCVILDCSDSFRSRYSDIDFAPFEALVSLKSLRLTIIYRENPDVDVTAYMHDIDFNVVATVLEKVPAQAKLSFGTVARSQQNDMVLELIDRRARGRGGVVKEAPADLLEQAAAGVVDLVRGCKSGNTVDVYAESRTQYR